MDDQTQNTENYTPPAMGERYARWGFGYQDKIATEKILNYLRIDIQRRTNNFEGVKLADLEAGRVDDFVLVFKDRIEGNSIKWSSEPDEINWSGLIGIKGLLKELHAGSFLLNRQSLLLD